MIIELCLLILLLLYVYYRWSIRHLTIVDKMFPGPPTLPILGNALMLLKSSEEFYDDLERLGYFYRRSFRVWLGPKVFIVSFEPYDAEVLLGSNVQLDKSEVYDFLKPWIGEGLLTSTGKKWKQRRKILTPAFHFKILERFIDVFENNGEILCEKFSALDENEDFNVHEYIKLYALDNICETAMGISINAQHKPKSAYVKAIKDMCTVVFRRSISIWLHSDFIFQFSQYAKMQKEALAIIHNTTKEVIRERKLKMKENPYKKFNPDDDDFNRKEKLVFLDILLQHAEENNLSDEDIREEVDTFMFEGHDTITSAISFSLFNLSRHPDAQEKAYQEQLAILGSEDRSPTYQDLQSMKYLEQIIKETLRLYPSVPMIARTVTENLELDPLVYCPKGSQIILAIQGLHGHARLWGMDKFDKFDPENFSPEAVQNRHPYLFVPFSAGPRNCIGQRFAMLEMKSALSKIIRRFQILPSLKQNGIPRKVVELILTLEGGTNIRVKPRK